MKKALWITLLLSFAAVRVPLAQGSEVKFSASDVKADLEYLYKTLEKSHYNLYGYVSKRKFDNAYYALNKSVSLDSLNLLETTKLYQKFAAVGNTGHSEIDFPAQPYISFAQKGGTVFPLELAFEDGKAYIRKSFASNLKIKAGDQLLSIDNIPIKSIQKEIHPYLSAERPYFKDAKLEFWSFPRLYWSVFGEKATFNIKTRSPENMVSAHKLEAIPVMNYETERGGEILNEERAFKYFKDVAYLNPGPFISAVADGEEKYKAFIDSAFTDINAKNIKNLLIDFRNNSGGHNAYSDYLIAYFADKPFRWYSKFHLKTSEVLKEQTRQNAPAHEMDSYTKAILNYKDGEVFEYDLPIQNPVPDDKRFRGKVYVLVNRQTYSMAAVSAALIQDYGFAEIVGEETGDVPTLYASQFSFPLPRTGIMVKVPKGYIIRPNGDESLSGVIPDHKVRDHLLDSKDEVLDFTLHQLLNLLPNNQ